MTGTPEPGRPAAAPIPADERLRDLGQQMVTQLSAVIRIGRAYSVTNQVFRTQLANILAVIKAVIETSGEVVLVSLGRDLFLNGVRIPVTTQNFRFQQTVSDLFRERGVAGFHAQAGVLIEDLTQFCEQFLNTQGPRGRELIQACTDAGLERILPALHASTDPASENPWAFLDTDGDASSADLEGAGGAADEKTAEGTAAGRPGLRGAAIRHFAHTLQGARSVLTTTALSGGLEMRHAKRVVQPLVDGALASEPVVVGLSSLREHDEFSYAHAVNVCAVAVTMGHALALDRRSLADLGVAALLHDAGKSTVADRILHPMEAFTDEERAAAERHPIEGARLLARSTPFNPTTLRCMRVALEHHCRPHGEGGYPTLPRTWRISLLSQIVAVADCFVSLHTRSGELVENVTPYQALGMMLGPLRDRFDPALLWALVQALGFYPPGQFVELEDGFIAEVLAPNHHDLARPHVRVIAAPNRQLLKPEQIRELLPLPAHMTIRRALRGAEYPQPDMDSAAA